MSESSQMPATSGDDAVHHRATQSALRWLRDLIQHDVGKRGLRSHATDNLVTACAEDFEQACRHIANCADASIAIVTGFFIPSATPPAGETDGPLGAVFLARALVPLGIRVILASDEHSAGAIAAGLEACGLTSEVTLMVLPGHLEARQQSPRVYFDLFRSRAGRLTHLIALERVGPAHGDNEGEPAEACYSMRGFEVTEHTSPAHWLFECAAEQGVHTIGIGDGGNELGMGKIPRQVIAANILLGERTACRVACAHLIVAGISNWGAYGLATAVRWLRGARGAGHDPRIFDTAEEKRILQTMVEAGPLVDGVTGLPTATVDGQEFENYIRPLEAMGRLLKNT